MVGQRQKQQIPCQPTSGEGSINSRICLWSSEASSLVIFAIGEGGAAPVDSFRAKDNVHHLRKYKHTHTTHTHTHIYIYIYIYVNEQ